LRGEIREGSVDIGKKELTAIMSKSLRVKLVFIMLLVIVLMTVVLAFLVRSVQNFYTGEFYTQMESVLTQSELVHELRAAAGTNDAVERMENLLLTFSGELGIDRITRNFYILSGTTGEVLETSAPDRGRNIELTPNILSAMTGDDAYSSSSRADYMDVAVTVTGGGGARFVVYIIDNMQTVQDLNAQIFRRILEAVLIGFAISIAISLIISKTLLSPIQGMTKAAEAMADGDFSRKIHVESEDEIGILSTTFNDMAAQIETMLEELKKAEIVRREFVANVSHELRTPLGYAEGIEYGVFADDEARRGAAIIVSEADRLGDLVEDLLYISRIEALEAALLPVDLCEMLGDAAERVRGLTIGAGKTINCVLPDDPVVFNCDERSLTRAVLNILANAVKYARGTVTLELAAGEGRITITVTDDGEGIAPEALPRIFERFYKGEAGGYGIGLAIAKAVTEKHGGRLSAENTGAGAVFTMVFNG
jgi:signal transduction histidine kinase